MRRLALLGAIVALSGGCVANTPFPLTPVAVMFGGWPPKVPVAEAVDRDYRIVGDTFTVPSTGLAITRASADDWSFQATAAGVAILKRNELVSAAQSTLQISIVPLPAGVSVADALLGDRAAAEQQGQGVAIAPIVVDGLAGESWIIKQPAKDGQGEIRTWRCYLVAGEQIVLAQGQAAAENFYDVLPAFESMLTTLRTPNSPNAPQSTGETVKKVDLGRADSVVVPLLGLTLQPLDPRVWLTTTAGAETLIERRTAPVGAIVRPTVSVTTGTVPAGQDFAAAEAARKAAIEQAGSAVTTGTATVDGKAATTWEWTTAPAAGQSAGGRFKRLLVMDGAQVAIIQATADTRTWDGLAADFDAVIAAIKLPAPAPAAP